MNPPATLVQTAASGLARPRQLVQAAQLAALLRADGNRLTLIEVGNGGPGQFAHAHIPGAVYLDTTQLETGPHFNKVADHTLLGLLLQLGVRHDSTVVLYGRSTLAAARAAQLMLYAGVADVRLLDGGFAAWRNAGLPCAAGAAGMPVPACDFGAPFPGCPHYLLDTVQAAALLGQAGAALVSVRTWSEYSGATSGYSYIAARGDIAGALWGRAGREGDVNSMSEYQLPDGSMLAAADIVRMWRASGIHSGQRSVFYCGTGWRASLAFFYAWLMGWDDIAVYDGGWFEWSADPARPALCRIAQSPAPMVA